MRQTKLKLSKKDRHTLQEFRSKGNHMAREFNRAHILAALDRNIPESEIMAVLGVGRTAIWRTRAAYSEGGLEFALHDMARPGKPKRYRTNEEAHVAALACSAPPAGAERWTVALLTEVARSHPNMGEISRETIRRFLKKTASNRGVS
jgi:transposase